MPGQHVAIRTRTEWANDANAAKILDQDGTGPNVSLLHATQPEQRWTEEDQTDPAGRWSASVISDVYTIRRAATADWATFTTIFQLDGSGWLVPDDVILGIGTSRDTAIINRSTINAADGEITNVIVGTSDHQGVAANSLIISNITASGDVQGLVNNGGNSLEWLLIDASVPSWHLGYGLTGDGSVYVGTGNSFDVYINKVKEIDYATGAMAFQQATTISTTATTLTLAPATSLLLEPAGFAVTMSQAASTTNEVLTVANTSNAAAASHAIVNIQVGGTTSTGDPQLRLTVPSGTSWYVGADNSVTGDHLSIGTGTTVGAARLLTLDGTTTTLTTGNVAVLNADAPSLAITDGATNYRRILFIPRSVMQYQGTTQVTALQSKVLVEGVRLDRAGATATVDAWSTISSEPPVAAGTNVTLTLSSAFRAIDGGVASVGTLTTFSGYFSEALTRGSNNFQMVFANGTTVSTTVPANTAGATVADDVAGNAVWNFISENGSRVGIGAGGGIKFSQAAVLDFGAFSSSMTASSAGVTRSFVSDITVGAGGAANSQLSQQFQLDSVFEAGLSGETDGAGGVTAATQVWKVPYRDSGVNVAAPAALNIEVLGGMRVEAGDDTNRIYFRANAAWHYINQTAGLSITAAERVDPWTAHRWEVNDVALVKMHRAYGDGGADFLPYPLEEGLRETLLRLLDVDEEFRQQVKEKLGVEA